MIKDLAIGLAAGLIALAATRWNTARPAPPGVYQAQLDQSQERAAAQALIDPPADRAVLQKLNARLPDIRCDAMRLDKLIEYLDEAAGVDLVVDWGALETVLGIPRDRPITLDLKSPTATVALQRALAAAAAGESPPAFQVDGGVVRIAPREQLAARTVTRVYDVRDLIQDALRPRAASPLSGATGTPDPAGRYPARQAFTEEAHAHAVEELINAVSRATGDGLGKANVSPHRYFAGRLIVEAPPADHEHIAALFRAMRAK